MSTELDERAQAITVIVDLAILRKEYRQKEWFDAADLVRDMLGGLGVETRDSKDGQKIRMKDKEWVAV